MANPLRLLFSERHHRLRRVVLWLGVFVLTLLLTGLLVAFQVSKSLTVAATKSLEPYVSLGQHFRETFESIHSEVTAPPCSAEFRQQLRRVAYRPDGFNEFLYAPGGLVRCSVNTARFDPPLPLGTPDFVLNRSEETALDEPTEIRVWIDRGLGILGLEGLTGTITLIDPFAIVLPAQTVRLTSAEWMRTEIVARGPSGAWWHRAGDRGVYVRMQYAEMQGGFLPLHQGDYYRLDCLSPGIHCAATEVSIAGLVSGNPLPFVLALLFAGALAQSLADLPTA